MEQGPNTGLAYFKSLPFKLTFSVSYNTNALKEKSWFWLMQREKRERVGNTPYCSKADVIGVIPQVKAHEGFAFTDVNSHTEVYRKTFEAQVRGPSERLVAPDAGSLTAEALRDPAHRAAIAESIRITDDTTPGGPNPLNPGCTFNYDFTSILWMLP